MKLTIILCVIFTLHFNYANGHLSDLFDGVHNKVHKVREDIHNFVFPKDKSDQNVGVPSTSESGNNLFFPTEKDSNADAPKPVTAVNKDDKQVEATTQPSTTQPATTQPATTQSATTQPATTQTATTQSATTQSATTQSATSTSSTTTTKQDSAPQTVTTTEKGRENFSGSCLTGYIRTPDGRCKPTF